MKKSLFIAILCCLLSPLSQALTFSGQVIDTKTGQSVPNIWVYVQDSAATMPMRAAPANSTGAYYIPWSTTPVLGMKFRIWTSSACGQGYRPVMVQYTGNSSIVTDLYVCQGSARYQLQGRIRLRNGSGAGNTMLYVLGTRDSTATDSTVGILDSFQTIAGSNGAFAKSYQILPGKNLILKAALELGHPGFGAYLPTYYSTFPSWQTAKPLTNYAFIGDTTYIDMIDTIRTTGPGCISGYARAGASPLPNRIIILTTSNNAAVGFTYTDFQGHFTFNNLGLGTYKVHGDILSKFNPALTMTLTGTKPCIPNLLFEETANMFAARLESLSMASVSGSEGIVPVPNPVLQRVRLAGAEKLEGVKQLSVRDLSGRLIATQSFGAGAAVELDAAAWPTGMYFLQLQSAAGTQTYRVGRQ